MFFSIAQHTTTSRLLLPPPPPSALPHHPNSPIHSPPFPPPQVAELTGTPIQYDDVLYWPSVQLITSNITVKPGDVVAFDMDAIIKEIDERGKKGKGKGDKGEKDEGAEGLLICT